MLQLNNISISFTETLFTDLSMQFPIGWTGISGANGCGKSSLARIIHNRKYIQEGSIIGSTDVLFIHQNPVLDESEVIDFVYSEDNLALKLASQLGIEHHWAYTIDELSFGQKRKLQLAMALAREPDILILDEPENHLDREARQLLINILTGYSGIGIIIGHSRDIMNALCTSTLLIHQGRTQHYPCGLSKALDLYESNQQHIRKQRTALRNEIKGQKQRLETLNRNTQKASNSLKKRGLDAKDSDSRAKIDLARLTGADKSSGRKVTIQKKEIQRKIESLEGREADKIIKTGLSIRHTEYKGKRIAHLPAAALELHPDFSLKIPELEIFPGDRIRIQGPNGSGKTSFMKFFYTHIQDQARILYCPQELNEDKQNQLLDGINLANDKEKGDIYAYFSRLQGDCRQLINGTEMSPGEFKKLFLAYHLLQEHQILLLDEPINHLDIFAVRSLEDALQDFSGTLIFISHEDSFLDAGEFRTWQIENNKLTEC